MKEYRLYFSDNAVAVDDVIDIVNAALDCFTHFECEGFWNGDREKATVIEVIGDDHTALIMRVLAEKLKAEFSQECVLLTAKNIDVEFI